MSCVDGVGAQSYARRGGAARNARAAQNTQKRASARARPRLRRAGHNFRRALLWCVCY
jgi:hypothetical protein